MFLREAFQSIVRIYQKQNDERNLLALLGNVFQEKKKKGQPNSEYLKYTLISMIRRLVFLFLIRKQSWNLERCDHNFLDNDITEMNGIL